MRFKNKVVLVTGAGQNTGLGIAAGFAAEGARIFLNDRTADAVKRAVAGLRRRGFKKISGAPCDISVRSEVEAMFRQIAAQTKRLDVLVNNAAHLGVGPSFLETPPEFFAEVVGVNLYGTFHCSQLAARMMVAQGGGAIVHIGSNTSERVIRNRSAYIASKGALDALTRAMAIELGPYDVRVNMVAAGYIHTPRWEALDPEAVARRRANVPLGKEATAEDIAAAVMFLASDESSRITGARLVVDGGVTIQMVPPDAEV